MVNSQRSMVNSQWSMVNCWPDCQTPGALKILQLPFVSGGPNHWAGAKLPTGFAIPPDVVSMANEPVQPLAAGQRMAGLLLDAWREQIPASRTTGGLTMQDDQPGSEPPQTLLLAVSPHQKPMWVWDDLVDTVLETMEMARKRAVEPAQIQDSYLGQFLPRFGRCHRRDCGQKHLHA